MAQIFKFSRHADQLTEIEKEKLRALKYSQITKQNGELLFPEIQQLKPQVDEIPPEEVAYSIE